MSHCPGRHAHLTQITEAVHKSRAGILEADEHGRAKAMAELEARVEGVDCKLDEMKQMVGSSHEAILSQMRSLMTAHEEMRGLMNAQQESMRASLDAVLQAAGRPGSMADK